jgi:TonB family protein
LAELKQTGGPPVPTLTGTAIGPRPELMSPPSCLVRRRDAARLWFRGCSLAAGLAAAAVPLTAQTILGVEHDGKFDIVRRATAIGTLVLDGGAAVPREGSRPVLKPASEYLPAFITVLEQDFQKGARAISDAGAAQVRLANSGRFVFNAKLEAPRDLDDVVLALVLESKEVGNSVYLKDLGQFKAHEIKRVSVDEVTAFKLLGVRLGGVHFFIAGKEVFNSTITGTKWETVLDRMVVARVAAAPEAGLKPLYVSDPVYPAAVKSKVAGKAVIACDVDEHGKVVNPTVSSATDPAFGAAALESVRAWRFVPAVKAGHAVSSHAEIPLDFAPR